MNQSKIVDTLYRLRDEIAHRRKAAVALGIAFGGLVAAVLGADHEITLAVVAVLEVLGVHQVKNAEPQSHPEG